MTVTFVSYGAGGVSFQTDNRSLEAGAPESGKRGGESGRLQKFQ